MSDFITIPIYYYVDGKTGEKVYDVESMREAFSTEITNLLKNQ